MKLVWKEADEYNIHDADIGKLGSASVCLDGSCYDVEVTVVGRRQTSSEHKSLDAAKEAAGTLAEDMLVQLLDEACDALLVDPLTICREHARSTHLRRILSRVADSDASSKISNSE